MVEGFIREGSSVLRVIKESVYYITKLWKCWIFNQNNVLCLWILVNSVHETKVVDSWEIHEQVIQSGISDELCGNKVIS